MVIALKNPLKFAHAAGASVTMPAASNFSVVDPRRVNLVMKLNNVDYDLLAETLPLVSSFTSVMKAAIAGAGHIPATAVKLALYPGSLVVEAQISPPQGTAPEAVVAFLNGSICNSTVDHLTNASATSPTLKSVIIGNTSDLNCTVTSLAIEDPPFPEESNRPWIALWSITILPPFSQDAAWRLLQMVNEPGPSSRTFCPGLWPAFLGWTTAL